MQTKDLIDNRWADKVTLATPEALPQGRHGGSVIVLGQNLSSGGIVEIVANGKFRHVVQGSTDLAQNVNTAALISSEPETCLRFPLATLLDPLKVSSEREEELTKLDIEFSHIAEQKGIRIRIDEMLEAVECPISLRAEVQLIADEFVTNAIFNAPLGSQSNGAVKKDEPAPQLPDGKKARLFFGLMNDQLVIGCQDPFGSLEPPKLLERMNTCHQKGVAESIRWDTRGAGIGSFLVFERSISYFIGVKKGQQTLVCSRVWLTKSERRRNEALKTLHWILI